VPSLSHGSLVCSRTATVRPNLAMPLYRAGWPWSTAIYWPAQRHTPCAVSQYGGGRLSLWQTSYPVVMDQCHSGQEGFWNIVVAAASRRSRAAPQRRDAAATAYLRRGVCSVGIARVIAYQGAGSGTYFALPGDRVLRRPRCCRAGQSLWPSLVTQVMKRPKTCFLAS
jgi:hypothetical protein